MYYRKHLSNRARRAMHNEYLERKEARQEEHEREKEEYARLNTYLFYPLDNKGYYFSFILMKNGNAKITDIHGDLTKVEIPEFILGSDSVSKKIDEQDDFSGKFPIKITVLGKIEVNNLKSLILPNTIGKIFEETFKNNTTLEYVELPKYLKEIGDRAFSGCTSLSSVAIPYSTTKIGDYAFAYCENLKSIKLSRRTESYGTNFLQNTGIEVMSIPVNITKVDAAFNGMKKLKRLYIHDNVQQITAVFDSQYLSKIVVDHQNKVYDSRNDCNAIIETQSNKLVLGCKNTRLPNDVRITNLILFSSYPEYLIISDENLFSLDISPIKKFIMLNYYPYLYFTYEKSIAKDKINWYSINIKDYIDYWFHHNQEKYKFSRRDSDKCLIDTYLYKPLIDDIQKVNKLSFLEGNFIDFHYPFAFYKGDWKFDDQNEKPKLVISRHDDYLFGYKKEYISREALVHKCEDIFNNHLFRFYSSKSTYKKEYISKYGIYEYKKNTIKEGFMDLFIENPHKNVYSYYVDNTWVSWTEIRGSEYNEICSWNNEDLEWEYDSERIW